MQHLAPLRLRSFWPSLERASQSCEGGLLVARKHTLANPIIPIPSCARSSYATSRSSSTPFLLAFSRAGKSIVRGWFVSGSEAYSRKPHHPHPKLCSELLCNISLLLRHLRSFWPSLGRATQLCEGYSTRIVRGLLTNPRLGHLLLGHLR
jgi:hypothetical protein